MDDGIIQDRGDGLREVEIDLFPLSQSCFIDILILQ